MEGGHVGDEADAVLSAQGAEAKVYLDTLLGQRVVVKERCVCTWKYNIFLW